MKMSSGFTLQKIAPRIRNTWIRDGLSEMLSTFILAIFIYASGAQFVLSRGEASSVMGKSLAVACGLTLAVYSAMKASGSSANPAVTLMFCLTGRVKWKKYMLYVIAELIGSFLAAAVTYMVYRDALNIYDGGVRSITGQNATAHIFATYPLDGVSKLTGFFDIVVGTGLLIGCIASVIDPNNANPDTGLIPVAMTIVLYPILMSFGYNTGAAINFGVDFSGRLFTFCAGWGSEVFSHKDYWFWVPLAGTISGSFLASCVYQFCIGQHLDIALDVPVDKLDISINQDKNITNNVEKKGVDNVAFKNSGDLSAISSDSGMDVGNFNSSQF